MFAGSTGRQFLKLVPIVDNFVATGPTFLQIVENWLPRMEVTTALFVLGLVVVLQTTVTFAALLRGLHWLFIKSGKLDIISHISSTVTAS